MRWAGIFLLMAGSLRADPILFPERPTDFGGGLNLQSIIADNESPDTSNMINGEQGAAVKRNGSKRWNDQAVSSETFNWAFRHYASSNTSYLKSFLFGDGDTIYHTTSSLDSQPFVVKLASGLTSGQKWRWITMNNRALGFGDGLADEIKMLDLRTSSFTNLIQQYTGNNQAIRIRGKYPLTTRNYLLVANCVDVTTPAALVSNTTYYPSRIYYSVLEDVNPPSTFTVLRYIGIRSDDGESLTGVSELDNFVHAWKETSISEIDATVFNPSALGGDIVVKTRVQGFGLYAPDTLANIGDGYIFGAKDGIRFWDGGRKTRLQVEQESRIISDKIKPIVDRLIKEGTYRNSVGKYYPKKGWYVFSYEDPLREPRGRLNSALVLDLATLNWYPFRNWHMQAIETMDGIGDNGELIYVDNGYVHIADRLGSRNDSRREIIVDGMDSTWTWRRSYQNTVQVLEGTASLRMVAGTEARYSSMTSILVYPMNTWPDGAKTSLSDKIHFKVYPASLTTMIRFEVHLEVNDNPPSDFDVLFASVVVTSNAFTNGNNAWSEFSIPLSSFSSDPNWTALEVESAPYALARTYYGIRFFSTGTTGGVLSVDDLRFVEDKEQPLNAYRFSKFHNLGTFADKRWRKLVVDMESPSDGTSLITFYDKFGEQVNQVVKNGGFRKEIYVTGYGGIEGVAKLDSVDFTLKESTRTVQSHAAWRSMTADKENIYAGDIYNHVLYKIPIASFSALSFSTFGSLGDAASNYYNIFQISQDDDKVSMVEFGNHRMKINLKEDLSFYDQFGSLGSSTNTDKFHLPTGIAETKNRRFVFDDGNRRIVELSKSTHGFIRAVDLPLNTLGNGRLLADEKHLYAFYGNHHSTSTSVTEFFLEKRDISNPDRLLARVKIKPSTASVATNGIIMGDPGQNDEHLFLSFTDDRAGNGLYYIQKILKEDLSLVKEHSSSASHYAVVSNGLAYLPKRKVTQENIGFDTGSEYLQIKWSEGEGELDNNMKLYSYQFIVQGPVVPKEKD